MKSNQKCVRMSDEVLAIVERMPGDGFNQKFENMVLTYAKKEAALKKRISNLQAVEKRLDKAIEEKQKTAHGYLREITHYLEYAAAKANQGVSQD